MSEIVVTGEALGAARKAFAEACRSYDRASDGSGEPSPMLAALQAAAPHLQARVDRHAIRSEIIRVIDKSLEAGALNPDDVVSAVLAVVAGEETPSMRLGRESIEANARNNGTR